MKDLDQTYFVPGQSYRRRLLHQQFGGQRQGGISTPQANPLIFLFTGPTGTQYGYSDGWQDSGLYFYTGEGQSGDMQVRAGNKAVLTHVDRGKDLHLFEQAQRAYVRYLGQFVCTGSHRRLSADRAGAKRQAIVFELIPLERFTSDAEAEQDQPEISGSPDPNLSDLSLRSRALTAALESLTPEQKLIQWRRRSQIIRRYVLSRAKGICEGCTSPAPFLTTKGEPYLEPHHIRRLSDGGPDDPRWIAAVCANCHRRAHHANDAKQFNNRLAEFVRDREASIQSGHDQA